jgi:DMSO/TMAO reductase YedYZ molybdopterin-dependent catalytic subunit
MSNMDVKLPRISLLLAAAMVLLASLYGVQQLNRIEKEDHVEILDYQGVRLSSVKDFRENSIKGPQKVNISDYRLSVHGLVSNPLEYTYDDVLNNFKSHKKVVTLNCVEGWSSTVLWEGVKITDLVKEAKPKDEALIIIFHAKDGYTTSLTIDYIRDNGLILAYKINEVTLPEENGFPFMLVAESKWGYKWCRWITALEFSDDADYEGFWEQRGYSNTADIDDSYRGN